MYSCCASEEPECRCNTACCQTHCKKNPDFTKEKFPIQRFDVGGGVYQTKKPKKKKTKNIRQSHSSTVLLQMNTNTMPQVATKRAPSKVNIPVTVNPPSAFTPDCACTCKIDNNAVNTGNVVSPEKVEETCEEFMNIVQDAVLETVEKSVKCIMDGYFGKITRKLDAVCMVVQEMKEHIWKLNKKNDIRFKCLCEFLFEHLESPKKDKDKDKDKQQNSGKIEKEVDKKKSNCKQHKSTEEFKACCCQHRNRDQESSQQYKCCSCQREEEQPQSKSRSKPTQKNLQSRDSRKSFWGNAPESDSDEANGCQCKKAESQHSKKKEIKAKASKQSVSRSKQRDKQNEESNTFDKKKRSPADKNNFSPAAFVKTMEVIGNWKNRYSRYKQEKFGTEDTLDNCIVVDETAAGSSQSAADVANRTCNCPYLEVIYYSSANIAGEIKSKISTETLDQKDNRSDKSKKRARGGDEKCCLCGRSECSSQMSMHSIDLSDLET